MITTLSKIGYLHNQKDISNQDGVSIFDKIAFVTDGCSGSKSPEWGVGLFHKLLSKHIKKIDNPNSFDENIKYIFDNMFKVASFVSNDVTDFCLQNYTFTVLALFQEKDKYVVKVLGDGIIITKNTNGNISYITLDYGDEPPYYIYNYIKEYPKKLEFKTFNFRKEDFISVGVATDGLEPIISGNITKEEKRKFDNFLINPIKNKELQNNRIKNIVERNSRLFYDDTTLVFFGEED